MGRWVASPSALCSMRQLAAFTSSTTRVVEVAGVEPPSVVVAGPGWTVLDEPLPVEQALPTSSRRAVAKVRRLQRPFGLWARIGEHFNLGMTLT